MITIAETKPCCPHGPGVREGSGYARISSDREGLALGVGRQTEDIYAKGHRDNVHVKHLYFDNDRGASTRSRKPRPDYKAMMHAASVGDAGEVIVSYSNSRLTRRPMEVEEIIALHKKTGILFTTCVSGDDDLATADGRMMARLKGGIDAAEAERVAERVARVHLANALLGRPVGGTRPFGYDVDKATLLPDEADALLQAATNLILGMDLNKAADVLNKEGFTTTRKGAWQGKTLRQTLMNPRLAGWRIHNQKQVIKDGLPVRGLWEPLMDQDVFDRLQLVLKTDEERTRIPRKGARHYLLTGLVRCGVCNGIMYGSRRTDHSFYYSCNSNSRAGHSLSASGMEIDKVVTAQILLKMTSFEALTPDPTFDGAGRLKKINTLILESMAELRAGRVSSAVIYANVAELEKEQKVLDAARGEWLRSAIGPKTKKISSDEWEDMDTDEQRRHVEKFLTALVVSPATKKARTFDPTRLTYVWREGD